MELDDVEEVTVNMTSQEKKPNPLEENSGLKNVKSIIAISSCKGGVGKSTVAASLAKEVSQRGFSVGLLDADLFGPSVPTLFNLQGAEVEDSEDKKLIPLNVDGLKVMSFGFFLGDQPAVMRGPMVSNYIKNLLHGVEWGELDYLFLDMPPGTGDIQLTITQSIQLDGAVIVTTPQILSLVDVGKGILMFDKVSVPVLGVVENMAYFECDGCSKKHYIFGGDAANILKNRFGIEILARLPISYSYGKTFDKHVENKEAIQLADQVIKAFGKNTLTGNVKPEIEFDVDKITLRWADGNTMSVKNFDLRVNCKCANCIHEITGEKLLDIMDVPEDIVAEEIKPVGNYAISVHWSDGHSSGLYSYNLIKSLSTN
ncbi:MAG: P-loop NTPase [Nitrospinae bacterium]|nr:P-loop NTPase [Nitrospinota bacterium]